MAILRLQRNIKLSDPKRRDLRRLAPQEYHSETVRNGVSKASHCTIGICLYHLSRHAHCATATGDPAPGLLLLQIAAGLSAQETRRALQSVAHRLRRFVFTSRRRSVHRLLSSGRLRPVGPHPSRSKPRAIGYDRPRRGSGLAYKNSRVGDFRLLIRPVSDCSVFNGISNAISWVDNTSSTPPRVYRLPLDSKCGQSESCSYGTAVRPALAPRPCLPP